jgi:hypothetical protein
MNAKDAMIDMYRRDQESPWLTLAKRIVREDVARRAATKGAPHESVHRVEVPEAPGS